MRKFLKPQGRWSRFSHNGSTSRFHLALVFTKTKVCIQDQHPPFLDDFWHWISEQVVWQAFIFHFGRRKKRKTLRLCHHLTLLLLIKYTSEKVVQSIDYFFFNANEGSNRKFVPKVILCVQFPLVRFVLFHSSLTRRQNKVDFVKCFKLLLLMAS